MLEQILDFIHNYFVHEIHRGNFRIVDGVLVNVPWLQDGQYFKIRGSVFNDGVHKYSDDVLHDERFEGEVWSMTIPPAILAMVTEIETWVDRYGESSASPFTSESFGGYSYTKASGGEAGSGVGPTWQSVFGPRLNAYRKIS